MLIKFAVQAVVYYRPTTVFVFFIVTQKDILLSPVARFIQMSTHIDSIVGSHIPTQCFAKHRCLLTGKGLLGFEMYYGKTNACAHVVCSEVKDVTFACATSMSEIS